VHFLLFLICDPGGSSSCRPEKVDSRIDFAYVSLKKTNMPAIRISKFLVFLLTLCINISFGQSVDWHKSYGGIGCTYSDYYYDNISFNLISAFPDGQCVQVGNLPYGEHISSSDSSCTLDGEMFFIVKTDSSGNMIWSKTPGCSSLLPLQGIGCWGTTINVDQDENTLVAGVYRGSKLVIDSTSVVGANAFNIFLAKINAQGNVIWTRSAGGAISDYAFSVSSDRQNNVIVGGIMNSITANFDTVTIQNSIGGQFDVFIAKYDQYGRPLWGRCIWGPTGDDFLAAVKTDAAGNIYATGSFSSAQLTIDGDTLTNKGLKDIFLIKFDPDGHVLWAKSAGGAGNDVATNISIDGTGNVYVTGNYNSEFLRFDSDSVTSTIYGQAPQAAFLAKFSPSGNLVWLKSSTGSPVGSVTATCVQADNIGNVYLGGYYQYDVEFDAISLYNPRHCGFLVRYDTSGNVVSAVDSSVLDYYQVLSLAVDGEANLYCRSTYFNPDICELKLYKFQKPDDPGIGSHIRVIPNPTGNYMAVELGTTDFTKIAVFNSVGRLVVQKDISKVSTVYIDLISEPDGVYFVKAIGNNRSDYTKFVLIK
jgi:Secretion system C-terminal sorting domain/Beta-propeller repeat